MRKLLQEKGSAFKKIMSWILAMVILFTSVDMSAFIVSAENQESALLSDGETDSGEGGILTDGSEEPMVEQPSTEQPPAEQPPTEQPPTEQPPEQDSAEGEKETGYLTVKIFDDANKNGTWDEGEAGISNLEVTLSPQDTEEKIQIQASSDGVYFMDGIQEGIYTVRLSAASETVAPYNLTESVLLSPDGNNILYPNTEDTWFIGWTGIDVTKNHELVLGLQKDDLEKIEEEIGDAEEAELLETEEGVFFSADAGRASFEAANGFLIRDFIYYKNYQVDVWFDNGNSAGFSGCPSYKWIFRKSDNRILYCIEPFVNGINNGNYAGGGNMANAYGADKARYMQLCAYYGAEYPWPGATSDWSVKALYFMAAQNLIWKKMGAQHLQWYQYKGDYHGHFHPGYAINISYYENQIINKINNHSKMPSLPANQRIDHDYDNPDKVYSFTDKNGALGNGWQSSSYHTEGWWVKSVPAGVNKAWIEGNQLKFTLKNDASIDGKQITFPLEKWFSPRGSNQYYVSTRPRQQSLLYQGSLANIPYNWSVTINPTGQAKIKKVDDADKAVPGVTFKWGTDRNNLNHTTGKTGSDGTVTIQANAGTIYVQEHEVPSHLIKDDTIKSVQIQSGKTASLTFTNQRVTRNVSIKKEDSSTGLPIAGAKFQYWNEERPNSKYTATTDSKGEFTSSVKFPVGSRVTMKEIKAAPGYELPSGSEVQKTITVSLNESENKFTFKNTAKKIPVKLKKINARTGQPIPGGATFHIGVNLDNPGEYEVLTTGPDGTVTTKEYPHGTKLYYQEIKAPSGFLVDDRVYSVIVDASTSSNVQTVTVRNEESSISFSIKKKGDDGRPLAGVRFRLEKRSGNNWYTIHSNLVTDKNGRLNIPGTYARELIISGGLRLVEEATVPGYELLDEPIVIDEQYIQAESSEIVIELTNKKLDTRFQVYKYGVDTKKPLAGAVFEITDADGDLLQTLITNSKGIAETTELLADVTYYIEEIEAPKGYQKVEGRYPFAISTDGGAEPSGEYFLKREVPNEPYKGRIKVKKVNQDGLPLSGIEFTIYKGTLAVEKLTTNEKGEAVSDWLTADSTYRIKETYTPPQFEKTELLDYTFDFLNTESRVVGESWKVDVTKNEAGNEITASFEVTNKELLGRVTIKKVDADNPNLVVQGATFELYNRYDRKTLLARGTTDETGKIVFDNLPIVNSSVNAQQGHYYLEETTPGENHVLPENTGKYFSLTTDQLNCEVTFKNPPVKGSVEITKVDKDDPSKKLEGAEFAIYRADDLNTVLKTVVTGKDGIARFDDLRYGEYVIRETKAPDGYLNDVENGGNDLYNPSIKGYPVTIEKHGQIIPLTIANPAQKVQVEISKCNSENKKPLAYVRFNIMSGDGELIETVVTNSNGKAVSQQIPLARLGSNPYVVEAAQVPGYEPNNTHYPIKVEAGSTQAIQIVKIDVENTPQKTEFKLRKVGDDGEPVQAEFRVEASWVEEVFGPTIKEEFNVKTDASTGLYNFNELVDELIEKHPNIDDGLSRPTFNIYETKTEPQYQLQTERLATIMMVFRGGVPVYDGVIASNKNGATYDEDTLTITVVNKKIPIRLTLVKYDRDNPSKYLAGAVFRITPSDNGSTPSEKPIEVTTTDSPDGIEIELPYARYYQVQEIQAPPGYYTTGGITTYEIFKFDEITENGIVIRRKKHTESNTRTPEMKIRKVGENGEPLDAEFIITDEGTGRSVTVKTQAENGGYADVDVPALNEFWNVYNDKNRFKIEEVSVDNPDYEILKEPVYLDYSIYMGKLTFQEPQSGINPDGVTITVEEAPSAATIKIPNKLRKIDISLNLIKEDAEHSGTYLPGAVFEITPEGYAPIRVTTTASPDGVRVENLPRVDSYSVQEIQAPEGYILNPTIYTYTLDEFENEYGLDGKTIMAKRLSVSCDNKSVMGNLRIRKVDQENGELLSGAEFEIRKGIPPQNYEEAESNQYEKVGIITIDTDGTGEYNNLPYGKYFLREIQAPEGYQISKELIPFAIEKNQQVIELDVSNRKLEGELTIVKVDSEDNQKPLAGAVFTVHRKDTNEQVGDRLVTGPDGKASMSLPYGEYYVKEVSFPSGYASASGKTYDFTLDGTHIEVTKNISNTKSKYALRLFKTDRETGEFLAGAVFGLYANDADPKTAEPIQKFTTNANGSAVVFLAKGGHYDIYELQAPAGYQRLTEKFEVYVDDKAPTVEITVENTKQSLNIEIHKTDEAANPLAGAVFEIRNAKTGALVAKTEPINSTGKVTVQVPAGDYEYTVTEIQAPDGYVLDSTPRPVILNKGNQDGEIIYTAEPVEITNRQMKGNIKLVKVDGESNKPLEGAVFGVYDSKGELVDTLTTNSNGEAMSKNLPNGKYTLKELTPPPGYEHSEKTYNAELTETGKLITITAENTPLKGGFTVRKTDAQKPGTVLSGAVFRVYASYEDAAANRNYVAEKTTGANGLAVFENLSYGTYYVKETKAPEGYELNTRIFTVTVDGESAANLVLEVENHKKLEKGIFRVKKKDADTGAALKGAEFLVEGNSYSHTYTTGEDGTFETEELAPGTYTVTETKAPDGYRISKNPTRSVVVKAGDGIAASSPVVEYEFTNEKIQFPIRIVKTDDSSEPKPLAGAVFELYRLNEQNSHEGEALETLVTDINGEATSKMLPVGRYEVVEVTPPEGYKLSEQPSQIVEITKDTPQETPEFTVTFRNSLELGSLKVLKLGLPDKDANVSLGNPLAGAEFEVTSASSGQTYKETTNSEGVAEFKNLPFGIYNVREVKVPAGYEDDSAYFGTVVIGKDTPVVEITAYNYKKYGALSLKKTDSETGNLVAGATYGIYTKLAENGDVNIRSYLGEAYNLVTLPEQAYVTSKQLELGTYYIKEIASPPGYKLNPTVYPVTLTDEIPVVQIDAVDEPYKGSVSIHKTDEHNNPLEGAVFALYTKEDYDKIKDELKPGEHFPDVLVSYLTTDSQGNASKEDLVLGQTYVLTEFIAPAGYKLQFTPREFTPTAEKRDFEYQAENKKKRELIIHKVNESGAPVSDVMFSVYRFGADGRPETPDDGEAVAVLSPGITGDGIARMDISHFENGWYYVKETQGSEMGYEVSQEIITFEITDEKKEYEFTFVNYRPKGEIEIQKKDELGNPLPGAEFTLNIPGPDWYNGKNPNDLKEVAKFELDENGYGILKDIEASVYVIRETKAPAGYKPVEDILVVMHRDGKPGIKNDRVYYYYHADIVNKPITGWISIQKQANLGEEPVTDMDLSNARFEIRDAKGELVDTLITAKDGTAVSRELPVGTYTIKETQAPQGTILNENEGKVSIDGTGENDIYTYTHVNQVVKGKIQIKKVDGDNSTLTLEGAEFDILREDGTLVEHLVTGKDGIATSNYLPYGWYILRETKAPSGYALQLRDMRCLIQKENQLLEIVVENMKSEDAEVLVVKYDKDNPEHYLKGAEFKLYKDEALSQQIGETFTTDDKGRIYFRKELNLERGKTYYLQETKAPDGYVLDETVHSFVLNPDEPQSIALYIPNEMGKGYIRFDKTGEMLTGMEDAQDYPNLKKLIWEEQTLMDAEIGIYAKAPVTLDGRTYQAGELIQRLKSGETSRALPLGTYRYKELSAPDGYILDETFHDIEVTKNNVTEADAALATLKNDHTSVSLELHKKFKDGNTPEKLGEVVFGVYTAYEVTENNVTIPAETLLGIIRINENGQSIENHLKLPEGTYYVMELETADGYVLDGHKYPFTTGYQNEDRVIEISSAEAPIINEPVYGTIRIEKTGDMFTKVEKLVNQEGKYQVNRPVYGKGELKGAEFEIRAKDEVVVDGKTFAPGQVIDKLITGERDESIRLPLGTYILVETKAPDGYILNDTPQEVTILPNQEPAKPSVAIHTMENKKAVPEITLYKSFFGKTQEEAATLYTKVLFGIYPQEEIRGATNEAVLKADELVGLIRIDGTGKGTLKEDTVLPLGKYYVKELETAEGYQVSEKEYSFEITKDNAGTGPVTISGISEDTPVVNLPEGAEVPFAFRKIGEDGQPLGGAVFRLYTCKEVHEHSQEAGTEGSCWKEIYGLSPKTSGADGIVDFGILPDGTYQLKETEAPDGYVLPAGQWRFTVNSKAEPGEHIKFTPTGGAQPPAFQKAEEGAVYQYQVLNRKARQMPFTGGAGMLDYAAGGGALLALAEIVNRRRKKKNKGSVQ